MLGDQILRQVRGRGVGWDGCRGLETDGAELSIKSSSLSSILKALFISLLSGLSGEEGHGSFPWMLFATR